ncbi:MAG: metallophosphoesterase [Bacteroidota bacterium]
MMAPPREDAAQVPYPRTLAHLSDVHFGKISDDRIVGALVSEVNASGVDLVVVSGDLTQRARTSQFQQARAMLDAFDPPVLVVPGNHDVRAWWHNPIDRLWRPDKRFREHITDDLAPAVAVPGLAVLGLNSAHGRTIKGGRIRPDHVDAINAFFRDQPEEAFRILTLHHHLLRLEGLGSHDVSRGASRALDAAHRARVDLILCGHLHRSHVAPIQLAPAGDEGRHRIVVASAGTATSSRGRGDNAGVNIYNWIRVGSDEFSVSERRFDNAAGRFQEARVSTFERVGLG